MRRSPGRTRWLLTVLLLIVLVIIIFVVAQQATAPADGASQSPSFTLDPRIIDNLTQLPQATPLAGRAANDLTALRLMVEACGAYDEARRQQMIQQIGFIIDPSNLSADLILALGPNPRTRLLTGLGQLTATQWRLLSRPADSCLISIGKRINQLLVAAGETPLADFVEGSS